MFKQFSLRELILPTWDKCPCKFWCKFYLHKIYNTIKVIGLHECLHSVCGLDLEYVFDTFTLAYKDHPVSGRIFL